MKVYYDAKCLTDADDCAVPIKINGVTIGFVGTEHNFPNARVDVYVELPASAYGYAETPEDVPEVSEDMVLGYVRRLAKAFGVDSDEIEIEHKEAAE